MSGLTLIAAVDLVARVVERRNSIPILGNTLLEADGETLRITGTDLDCEVVATVPFRSEKFATTVEAGLLQDVLRRGGSTEGLRTDGNKLVIGSGPTFSLFTLPADDFPRVKGFEALTIFEVSSEKLASDLHAVSPGIGREETRYYLTGVCMEARNGKLSYAATDGHRLHLIEREPPPGAESLAESIVPRKAVFILKDVLAAVPRGMVRIEFGERGANKARFTIGPVSITTKLIDGTFPDVRRVIPTADPSGTLVARASALAACAKAAMVVSPGDQSKPIEFAFKDNLVKAHSPDGAEMTASMPGETEGEPPASIGFNTNYLLPACERFDGYEVKFAFGDSAAPAVMSAEGSPLLVVLMPMRI